MGPEDGLRELESELFTDDISPDKPGGFFGQFKRVCRYIAAPLIPLFIASFLNIAAPGISRAGSRNSGNRFRKEGIELGIQGPGKVKRGKEEEYTVILESEKKFNYSVVAIGGMKYCFDFPEGVRVYLGTGDAWVEDRKVPILGGNLPLSLGSPYESFVSFLSGILKGVDLMGIENKRPEWVDSGEYEGRVASQFKSSSGMVLLHPAHKYVFPVKAKKSGVLKVCAIYAPFSPLPGEPRLIEGYMKVELTDKKAPVQMLSFSGIEDGLRRSIRKREVDLSERDLTREYREFFKGAYRADVTGDGKREIVIGFYPNLIIYSGDFSRILYNREGYNATGNIRRLNVDDIDYDGRCEVFFTVGACHQGACWFKDCIIYPIGNEFREICIHTNDKMGSQIEKDALMEEVQKYRAGQRN